MALPLQFSVVRVENFTSPRTRRLRHALSFAFVAAAAWSCGTNSIQTATVTSGLTQATSTGSTSTTSSSGGSVVVSTSNAVAPLSFRVGTVGYNPVTVTVSTQSTLQVQFQAEQQDQSIAGTNFEPEYSMLGVYITVGSTTTPTQVVPNGYNGTLQTPSSIIDFSSAIPSGSNGSVTIVIAQPNYDYDCLNFDLYCYPVPWMHVLDTHPWHGTLFVQTDNTQPLSSSSATTSPIIQ